MSAQGHKRTSSCTLPMSARARIQEPRWHRSPHDAVAHAFTATQHVPRRMIDFKERSPVEACQRSWRDSGVRGFTHHAGRDLVRTRSDHPRMLEGTMRRPPMFKSHSNLESSHAHSALAHRRAPVGYRAADVVWCAAHLNCWPASLSICGLSARPRDRHRLLSARGIFLSSGPFGFERPPRAVNHAASAVSGRPVVIGSIGSNAQRSGRSTAPTSGGTKKHGTYASKARSQTPLSSR